MSLMASFLYTFLLPVLYTSKGLHFSGETILSQHDHMWPSSMESLLDPTRQYIHGSFCCPPFDPQRHQQKNTSHITRWLINVDDIPNCSRLIRSIYNGPKLESIDLKWFLNMDISRFQLQQSCGVEAPVYFTGFLVTLLKRSFMWNTTSSRLEKVQCSEESFALIQQKIHIARRLMYIKKSTGCLCIQNSANLIHRSNHAPG